MADLARFVLDKLVAFYLGRAFLANALSVLGFLAVIAVAEWVARRPLARYRAAGVSTDVLYTVFYVGGIYALLVGSPLGRLLRHGVSAYAPFLDAGLLRALPAPVHAMLALVAFDCARYWLHRWTHASPLLWTFHRIHHSQETLNPLTNYRFHFVDQTLHGVLALVVYLLLGTPAVEWLAVGLAITWLHLLAHTGYPWGFGPLESVFVSPRYHSRHHAVDGSHADRNFGFTLSLWDRLFGTLDRSGRAPSRWGIADSKPPESFFRQIPEPFLSLLRGLRRSMPQS